MPDDYQGWGVIRTRAYVQLLEITSNKSGLKTISGPDLEGYVTKLKQASKWSLEYCQHLTLLHARSVDVGEAA